MLMKNTLKAACIQNGVNIVGAHIDSPRLDLKPNPIYEDGGMAYFKTHYYGGIRKYQWLSIPLSLHGVIIKKDGTRIDVNVGEDESDPIFCITDLLPHLAQSQSAKKLSEAFEGEKLNVIVGNIPIDKDEKNKIKYAVMQLLNDKYGICETDFVTSELELVPAFSARDTGFDRSMIAGYGHDDRVCAYTALKAIIDTVNPQKTAVCLLVDKEEIGSLGNTGMQSRFFENNLAIVCDKCKGEYSELMLRKCLSNSACLSADVGAAFDSAFPEVYERGNSAYINEGFVITKYTGARGKSSASDANAEFVAKICRILEENDVKWQCAELGKVDAGGGGTIAGYLANLDIEVIDAGVPLLAMHSPYEIAGKFDIYMAYKGYKAFMNS
ncbi:MAG: aminopeptidase, partial [Clostridia bacterium]|nr:aminopeptidase [Clostridia bacterium]